VTDDLLAVSVIITVLASIATTIIGVVKAAGEARRDAQKAPIDRRRQELELVDQIREISGKMIEDLREEMKVLRNDIGERDTQIGKLEERMRLLIRESRQMRSGMEEALEVARSAIDQRPGSEIMERIVAALERGLQPITQDTIPKRRDKDQSQ
jgi:chorismate mutase